MKLELIEHRLKARAPLVAAHGTTTDRELLELRLTDRDGVTGRGEAAPLPSYDGVTLAQARSAIETCREILQSDGEREDLLARCAERIVLPQALAAIDLALWDLSGRRAGVPVWRLLGASRAQPIEVNATIGAADRSSAAAQASQATVAGFTCVKVKVGIGDDAGRVAAVRAATGPDIRIRLDANGAWSSEEALPALNSLAPAGVELCEEPVKGVPGIHALWPSSPVALALDESASDPAALEQRSADAICLKISRCGGISGVLAAARAARSVGYEVYLASTFDGPLGIAAALHAAVVIEPDRPSGLATLAHFELEDPFPPFNGSIEPPGEPGL